MEESVSFSNQTTSSDIAKSNLLSINVWQRSIQRVLSIEVENEFSDLEGKQQKFHSYITSEFIKAMKFNLPKDIKVRLESFSNKFKMYPSMSISSRRHLVVDARQFLYKLIREIHPQEDSNFNLVKVDSGDKDLSKGELSAQKNITLKSSLIAIQGIGPKFTERLAGLGILLVGELLEYFPRDYVDYSALKRITELEAGETATLIATVRRCSGFVSPRNSNLAILELQLIDPTGRMKVTRFLAGRRFSNQAYISSQARLYPPGTTVAVSGLVKDGKYGKSFNDPLIEVMENKNSAIKSYGIGQLLPVYNLTEGITADRFRDFVRKVLPFTSLVQDPLEGSRIKELSLLSKKEALMQIHRPLDQSSLRAARRRLVFDEFLFLQLGLLRRRLKIKSRLAPKLEILSPKGNLVRRFLDLLPFALTGSQQRVLAEIQKDISATQPMARLLQGDVGSGKTVVALAGLLNAVEAGHQGALMAPTEVLAEQHYRNFCQWLPQIHVTVELLTGSTLKSKRKQILGDLGNGSLKILVGTHALIEDPVTFASLGLVVVDEQHRFGVNQRNRLLRKGLQPHLLAMTATPIPRTLALSIHGDLDVSQIDELPPGRIPIRTKLFSGSDRSKAYQIIREKVLSGQQAYVVLPLVEESEKLNLKSAIEEYKRLSCDVFSDLNVGVLHGRMSGIEKQQVIKSFSLGTIQILVSTTVIEVGVDVPGATVMMIDNADRFGLAQLHQLRGRVGRGSTQSYCLLVNESGNPLAKQRLEVLARSNDGFEISEIDLRLRGPGQVLGTRQSGLPDFALASLCDDGSVLEEARKEALYLLENDPDLLMHPYLKKSLEEHWNRTTNPGTLN